MIYHAASSQNLQSPFALARHDSTSHITHVGVAACMTVHPARLSCI